MDINSLWDRFTSLEQHYSQVRLNYQDAENYYTGDFQFTLPENVNKIIPATGRNAVDIPATHIVTDNPYIVRNRDVHKGQKWLQDDGDVEQFMLAVLQANHQMALTPPLHEVAKFQFLRGLGIIYGPFLNREDHKDGRDDAIWFDVLDPQNVLLAPGPNPREAFIYQIMTVGEMEDKAATDKRFAAFDAGYRKSTDLVVLVEWYGDVGKKEYQYAAWVSSYISGSDMPQTVLPTEFIVEPRDSGYSYLPLIGALSGYGIRHYKPERMIQSIFTEQVKTLLIGEAFALSVADGYMGAAAFERYRTSNAASIKLLDVKYGAGSASLIPDDVFPIEPMRIPDAVMQNYRNMTSALEVALFSGVVGGQRPTGVDTATGLAILSGQARLKFGPPLNFLEGAVSKLIENIGRLVEHNNNLGKFRCLGREITASQLHNDFHCKVTLFSEAPEERNARNTMGLQLAASEKGPSEKYINENYFGIPNYEEDLKQKLKEKIMNGDAMKQALEQFTLGLQQMQAQADKNADQGGIKALQTMNDAAALMRSGRPGGLPQQEALPGSPEAMAVQQNGMQQIPVGAGVPAPTLGG